MAPALFDNFVMQVVFQHGFGSEVQPLAVLQLVTPATTPPLATTPASDLLYKLHNFNSYISFKFYEDISTASS